MKRVLIIGCSGAGKSTLARSINQITGIDLIYLDRLYWKPNYVEPSPEEWRKIVRHTIKEESWILDGNYGGTMEMRMQRADTIIYLDRSRWLCLFRVLYRTICYYGRNRPDMGDHCPERFSWSFLRYVFYYNTSRRPSILRKLAALSNEKDVFRFRRSHEIAQFLSSVRHKQEVKKI